MPKMILLRHWFRYGSDRPACGEPAGLQAVINDDVTCPECKTLMEQEKINIDQRVHYSGLPRCTAISRIGNVSTPVQSAVTCSDCLNTLVREAPTAAADPVSHPSHYTGHPSGVECITVTEHMNFNVGNAVKYLWRAGEKSKATHLEDLRKAAWYVQREIERLQRDSG